LNNTDDNSGQTNISIKKNAQFFLEEHASYKKRIGEIDTYKKISEALNSQLFGLKKILDIGNGGVFDYDTSVVQEIVGLDLFLDALPKDLKIPGNVAMIQGSALDIPAQLCNFDAVLMVMLIHHLVGDNVSMCKANVQKSFFEAFKALRSSGRLIVMDSCVPRWFFMFERLVFKPAAWIISKTIKHPPVLQYSSPDVVEMIGNAGFKRIEVVSIPKGRYILQFGVKFPSFMTPTQPTLFIGYKDTELEPATWNVKS